MKIEEICLILKKQAFQALTKLLSKIFIPDSIYCLSQQKVNIEKMTSHFFYDQKMTTIVFEIAEPHKKQRCTSKNSCFLHEI